jgi:hypothetical protein
MTGLPEPIAAPAPSAPTPKEMSPNEQAFFQANRTPESERLALQNGWRVPIVGAKPSPPPAAPQPTLPATRDAPALLTDQQIRDLAKWEALRPAEAAQWRQENAHLYKLPPGPGEPANGDYVKVVDTRTQAEKDFDAIYKAPSDLDYPIDWRGKTPVGIDPTTGETRPFSTTDLVAFDGELKGMLGSLNMPQSQGSWLADCIVSAMHEYNQMSEPQRVQWDQNQASMMSNRPDGAEVMASAKIAWALVKDSAPAFAKELESSGALKSQLVITGLALAALNLEARAQLAGRR